MQKWQYSTIHNCSCKVIEEEVLWGQTVCRIWLPNQDAVVRVPQSTLHPLTSDSHPDIEVFRISYIAAAAKVAEILESSTNSSDAHILLAPMESNVIPLPHQIHALSRAISSDQVRYLLADEVGLGKTIEAGLIIRELKLRGLVKRTLVVAPKGLAIQWVAEMKTHFNEKFTLVNPGDLDVLERLEYQEAISDDVSNVNSDYNPWLHVSQAIVTLDAVKPLSKRKGWSKEKVHQYNAKRYERLINGQWDLIIVDESHRLGGSTEQVARYKLGQGLSEAAPYLLLLTATPHQGKSDAFQRLMSLLDPMVFPDLDSVTRERVERYVIRTEKRKAVTDKGEPLFRPRTTKTLNVDLSKNPQQLALYEEVTEYVKEGYNQAIKDKKPHIGFLMVLLQRIVTSSTFAIRCTLERRLNVLEELHERLNQSANSDLIDDNSEDLSEIDTQELDGQELLDELVEINESGRVNEISQVQFLLDLARDAEATGPDTKTLALLDLIYQLQGEENDDQLKLLIFTEFVPTQEMLEQFLESRGIPCTTLNGSMSMDERRMSQRKFRDQVRVLISTDAGGEGLNLQFCHIVINYDLPWNPMRIEQRIGRVDRIGQDKLVRAINFIYENSVEGRVREVLESKLEIIFDETGIDKEGDVLDTSISGEMIEKMMTHVIMEDVEPDDGVEETVNTLKVQQSLVREECAVYSISDTPDLAAAEKLKSHPLPHWVEQMTTNFLRMKGCKVEKTLLGWDLTWPDGKVITNAIFQAKDMDSDVTLLTLENNRVRGLALNLPRFTLGQPLSCVTLDGLPSTISGLWGLFEIRLQAGLNQKSQLIRIPVLRRQYISIFLSEEGKIFLPTARHIWDSMQSTEPKVINTLGLDESSIAFKNLLKASEQAGQELFDTLQQEHSDSIAREEERGLVAFNSRRKAIERLGLPEVRQYRLTRCNTEESDWRNELESAKQVVPEIRPLLMMKLVQESSNV